jgi:ribosomal protein S27E
MAGVYRPRHPERTVLYRVLFHHFDRFLTEYESRFEREYGFFWPIVQEVVERYLDCGNPRCGFARIRCPDCREERLVMFSCRTRGFCPSCHAKRIEEWGEWMRETLLLDVPHRQVVFTIPKMLAHLLQVQAPAAGGSLPFGPPVLHLLLRSCRGERAYARRHRSHSDLRGPD